jgi:hypothetical protein
MKAIVLTYDKQVGLAELVIKSYLALWRECPFQFLVPRNDENGPHSEFLKTHRNVSIVGTPSSIRGTMSVLLDGLDDEAWIYWCIDDRYPVKIDQVRMQMVLEFIASGGAEHLNAIKLIHWKETADSDRDDISIGDRTFQFQLPHLAWGFWHHHFLKAKVLKEVFLASAQQGIADTPLALNAHIHKLPFGSVVENRVFPVGDPIIEFGETLVQGALLANAYEALVRYDCPVPDYKRDPRSVYFPRRNLGPALSDLNGKAPAPARPAPFARETTFHRLRKWVQGQK